MRGNLKVFSTRSMQRYTKTVISVLNTYAAYRDFHGISNIEGNLKVSVFADGELEVEAIDSVRGKDVFLFANSARNSQGISVDQNKIELYHTVDALRRAQAEKITLFEPYCSPARSDRTTRRNSVGLWVHLNTLINLGVNHFITFNLHSNKSEAIIDPKKCAIDNIPITSQLKKYISHRFIKSKENLVNQISKKWAFCSVDAGGEDLAKKFSNSFNLPLIIAHKQRDYSTVNKVLSVNLLSDVPVEDKTVWIVDDMIDTGGSMYKLVLELIKRQVAEVNIAVIHPVLSGPAINSLKELTDKNYLKNLLVTDTIDCDENLRHEIRSLQIVSTEKIAAEIIYRLNKEMSLSSFFESFSAFKYLENELLL